MAQKLQDYFPMIQSREEVLNQINAHEHLKQSFSEWREKAQKDFLDICTGVRGVKMLYDGFFKEVMNPEYTPQRLNDFLSLVLEKPVRVTKVLPNDSTRLTDESSLLIMDILVEFEDGGIGNVEVQKLGYTHSGIPYVRCSAWARFVRLRAARYKFPGQRSACYSADLLLRQYKRLRDEKKKKFSYLDIQTVYTIILFEKSPKEFKEYPDVYIHVLQQKSNSGIQIDIPQKFVYIPLDIFREKQHNEGENIHNRLEAWLTFFCRDEPEMILKLIEQYPEFRSLYEDIYELCRNVEEVMQLFSKELLEMDRNTVKLMIDEMQEELQKQGQTIEEQGQTIEEQGRTIEEQSGIIQEKDKALELSAQRIAELERELSEK